MTAAALCRNMATLKRCAAGFGSRQRPQQESRVVQKVSRDPCMGMVCPLK